MNAKLERGQVYYDTNSKEEVEFLYSGQTGLAIVCQPGDSGGGMQSSWGVDPARLTSLHDMSEEEVDEYLVANGYDPAEIARDGKESVILALHKFENRK